ncbi:hypothetical protein BDZ94DRAFT_1160828, partial [Collybia nuda]
SPRAKGVFPDAGLPYIPRKSRDTSQQNDLIPIIKTKRGPAYETRSPVEVNNKNDEIIAKMLDNPITLTTGELMGSSKVVRDGIKNAVTAKHKSLIQRDSNLLVYETIENNELPFSGSDQEDEDYLRHDALTVDSIPFQSFFISEYERGGIPKGSIICGDPVLQYLESLPAGEEPKQLYVAKESTSLRAVYPVINGVGTEESLLDGGSQIVSMAKQTALDLDISWDPDIVIHMQSANKQVEKTAGLARNVPFLFNDIVVYLQVHIIHAPAYKVLLGRPFNTLTESHIKNARDGRQVITITDPNTGRRCTIPTHAKGAPPKLLKRQPEQDFRPSMN